MAISNSVTTFSDGSPLSEGELLVKFLVVKPEHPEEEEILPVRVQRCLLSSEESAKAIIPLLLSRTTLPELFPYNCPVFIKDLSDYVCSLPGHVHHVHVYGHVVWDDRDDPRRCVWFYYLSPEELRSTDGLVRMSNRWFEIMHGTGGVQRRNQWTRVLEQASECPICLPSGWD